MSRRRNPARSVKPVEVKNEEIVNVVPVVEDAKQEKVVWFGDDMDDLIHENSKKVGLEAAVMMMQRLLGIRQTGHVNNDTLTAYQNDSGRKDFQASYKNLM